MTAVLLVKYSILLLYSRIFPQRWFRRALYATALFILSWWLAGTLTSIFQCLPISSQWDPTVHGYCINYGNLVLATGIINIITDLVIIALPIRLVWQLKLKRMKKYLTILTFVSGSLYVVSKANA